MVTACSWAVLGGVVDTREQAAVLLLYVGLSCCSIVESLDERLPTFGQLIDGCC